MLQVAFHGIQSIGERSLGYSDAGAYALGVPLRRFRVV
ncbi:dihydroxyacetone kinase, ATP-dependent [Bacillus cereus]|nr:dihydroxyacetone kinase, ATP-dependent [Bacillus cereus]